MKFLPFLNGGTLLSTLSTHFQNYKRYMVLLHLMKECFKGLYLPERNTSTDENLKLFKGHLSRKHCTPLIARDLV